MIDKIKFLQYTNIDTCSCQCGCSCYCFCFVECTDFMEVETDKVGSEVLNLNPNFLRRDASNHNRNSIS